MKRFHASGICDCCDDPRTDEEIQEMLATERKQAILRAMVVANEAPGNSHIKVVIHDMPRVQFDAIPGTMERWLAFSKVWAKDVELGGDVLLELYTSERSVREVAADA